MPFNLFFRMGIQGCQFRRVEHAVHTKRTPEGIYWVDWRKISDKFNLAMHIDYPNVSDAATARRDGLNPGGMIMIHGTPDTEENPESLFHTLDWTDGCIAMKNSEMREVWNLVKDGTMVEIRP